MAAARDPRAGAAVCPERGAAERKLLPVRTRAGRPVAPTAP